MGSQAVKTRLAFKDALPFDITAKQFPHITIDPGIDDQLIDPNEEEIHGTRSHIAETVVQGLIVVTPRIVTFVSPEILDYLLPKIMGAAENLDQFGLAETLPSFQALMDMVADTYQLEDCKVNRAVFSGTKGQPVRLSLECLAKGYTPAIAFPAISIAPVPYYVFHQGVLTVLGSARRFNQFELTVDNRLAAEHNNERKATDIDEQDRVVMLTANVPFTAAEKDLFTTPSGSAAGAAASLSLTNGGKSTVATIGNGKVEAKTPSTSGKTEIRHNITIRAYKTGSTPELAFTNDPVA